jgi:hypothetical protein
MKIITFEKLALYRIILRCHGQEDHYISAGICEFRLSVHLMVLGGGLQEDGKIKGKVSLLLTKHHAMKTYWGSGGVAPRIL